MEDLEIELGELVQKWIKRVGTEVVLDALDLTTLQLEERLDYLPSSSAVLH